MKPSARRPFIYSLTDVKNGRHIVFFGRIGTQGVADVSATYSVLSTVWLSAEMLSFEIAIPRFRDTIKGDP